MPARWNRRDVACAAIVCLAASLASSAGQGRPARRNPAIGFIIGAGVPQLVSAFDDELSKLGYVDGKNIQIERRFSRANSNDPKIQAAELAAMDLDLVVASALPFALLIRDANPRMPMVIAFGPGLVSNGFGASMERPGGIVTGVDELPPGVTARRLELLKMAAPRVSRVGLLSTTPGIGGHEAQLADAETAARRFNLLVKPYRASNRNELQQALKGMIRDEMEGLLCFQGGLSVANRQMIVDFAAEQRLPAIYQSEMFAEAGGLMTWAPNQPNQMRAAARYVDKILRGASPGDLPMIYPGRYFLTVNQTAATRIGLTFPASLSNLAHRVIS